MHAVVRNLSAVLAIAALAGPLAAQRPGQSAAAASPMAQPAAAPLWHELAFRSIGPAVTGGRIDDVEVDPRNPAVLWVAAATGGLWRSTNKGATWEPMLEDAPVSTFGDVAIAPSNPDVVWVGTGEQNNRQSTSWGAGVWRTTDRGAHWAHVGLGATRQIGRVAVDPSNPDRAWVAAAGNLWAPNPERGVFRTTDGGRTWQKVLFVDTLTGATDIVVDPRDGNTLYAATYQRLRRTWGYNGGGPGSGIWKSTDGGSHWTRLTNGLPAGDKGRIGLAISASDPCTLVARVEHATKGGVYRTEDCGATWTFMNELNPRPAYYGEIRIDPSNPRRVYLISEEAYRSEDGGKTFDEIHMRPSYDIGVHSDHHALWIDPANPDHLYLAGDGGLYESWDRARTFEKINNFVVAQVYNVGLDDAEPYNVFVGLQDNHSWMGPSATRHWAGILNDDWQQIGFSDGMYQTADPTSRYVYSNSQGGAYSRVDTRTGQILDIGPAAPEGEPGYRWDWTSPSLLDRFDPATLYVGANRLLISHDRGESWSRTPDLTKQIDRDTLRLMGVRGSEPMPSRNDGTESYGEITTIAQSPLERAVLWVGTDDGNVQVSRDGGATWTEVGRNLPRRGTKLKATTYVSRVAASKSGAGAAYVALDAHRDGDFAPYLFRTTDYGKSWTRLDAGLPADGSVNVVLEDADNPSLLFVGTEHALFASTDAGARWARLGGGLPTTLVDDVEIQRRANDLVVGTHGRGVWILDDIAPLAEWTSEVAREPAHLFSIRPATEFYYWKDTSYRGQAAWAGENPPFGALLSYHLASPAEHATIEVSDSAGQVVRTLDVPGDAGAVHRVAWDLRRELPFPARGGADTLALPTPPHPLAMQGPFVPPGTYTVTLHAGADTSSQTVEVQPDPKRDDLGPEDYAARDAFNVRLLALMKRIEDAAKADPAPEGLQRLRRRAMSLYGGLNGSGMQPGTLEPPTKQMVEMQRRLETDVDRVLGAGSGTGR